MTNTTRMRMTKEAAALIHNWRNARNHKSNSDAIYDLSSEFLERICETQKLKNKLGRYKEVRAQRDANARALIDSQKMLHEKDAELTKLKCKLADATHAEVTANIAAKRQERINAKLKTQLKNRSEWLALFVVSNVVGWGFAITLLAG